MKRALKIVVIGFVTLCIGYLALASGLVGEGLEWVFGRPQAIAKNPVGEGVYLATIILSIWLVWWGLPKLLRRRKAKRERGKTETS